MFEHFPEVAQEVLLKEFIDARDVFGRQLRFKWLEIFDFDFLLQPLGIYELVSRELR